MGQSEKMSTNTPKTDAEAVEAITGLGQCVGVNFARELERDAARLRAILGKVIADQESCAECLTEADYIEMRRAYSALPNTEASRGA